MIRNARIISAFLLLLVLQRLRSIRVGSRRGERPIGVQAIDVELVIFLLRSLFYQWLFCLSVCCVRA